MECEDTCLWAAAWLGCCSQDSQDQNFDLRTSSAIYVSALNWHEQCVVFERSCNAAAGSACKACTLHAADAEQIASSQQDKRSSVNSYCFARHSNSYGTANGVSY